ncbi:hypothetical protein F5Y16DRAFT_398477 [Xylariaceae sp. FL0255]|nr:hypothetical protein F5Y16DRAFT_398477 [Xylariaceae sp. FL0255]
MVGKKSKIPDAWDDDWETLADREPAEPARQPEPQLPMSKAERLAQHTESNKKLWASAEAPPEPFHFLATRQEPPLTSDFKPAMKVLSRKPTPQVITKRDPLTGEMSQLTIQHDDSDEDQKPVQLTPEEIRAKHQREREEKQRRYEEVRAKIFGTAPATSSSRPNSNPSSGTSTPGNATPPRSSNEVRGGRGRGRGRGGPVGHRHNDSRGDSSNNQRPGSQSGPNNGLRELYDPNYAPRPASQFERRGGTQGSNPNSGRSTPRAEDQVIRSPRGPPDGNSRGFARRGASSG